MLKLIVYNIFWTKSSWKMILFYIYLNNRYIMKV
jgi:hypothetical protein